MAQSQAARKPEEGYDGGGLTTARAGNPTDWLVGWKSLFWGCALVMGANIFLWVWDYKFAFTAGLNSASREFTLYYRTLFWGELISLGIFTGIWYGWLMRTGRALQGQPFSRAEEVRRIAVLWSIIGVTSLSIYIEASFWPNWDGAWHQTLVRDTALTPTHIPMFYFFFPLSVVLALGAYLYGNAGFPRCTQRQGLSVVVLPVDHRGGAGMHGGGLQRMGPQPLDLRGVLRRAVPLAVRRLWMARRRDVRGLGRDDPAAL